MKVLHVASSYPLHDGDPTAPFMEEMLEGLAANGHDITVVVPRVHGLTEGSRHDVRVIGAPYAPRKWQSWGYGRSLGRDGLRLSAMAVTPAALGSLAWTMHRQIRAIEPDLVHLHWLIPQGALSVLIPSSIPVVISVHGADLRLSNGPLRRMAVHAIERADRVIAASSDMTPRIADLSSEAVTRTRIIPHGANGCLFGRMARADARQVLGIDPGIKVVLGVGRLVRKKGFGILIESLAYLQDSFHIFIAGEGPQREELEVGARHVGANRVHLLGSLSRKDLGMWFAAADVVAVPSVPDGFDVDSGPVVLVEALASGRPVVATAVGMASDVIDSTNGVIVPGPSPVPLAEALESAYANAAKLGEGASRTFGQIGDWRSVALKVESVYSEAAQAARTRTR